MAGEVMRFFLPMIPPTVTKQTRRVFPNPGDLMKMIRYFLKNPKRLNMKSIQGFSIKPVFKDTPGIVAAKGKFTSSLAPYRPEQPFSGPVRLITRWCFPMGKDNADGQYKHTKPDTDNSLKMFKDCMTELGFWNDDAQVASELTEKFWAQITGIYVEVIQL